MSHPNNTITQQTIFTIQPKQTLLSVLVENKNLIRLFTALWLTFTANTVFFTKLAPAMLLPSAILLLLLNTLIVFLLSSSRLFKPSLILLLFIGACSSYFIESFGIMIDSSMLQNVIESNVSEAKDLINVAFMSHLCVYGLLPSLVVVYSKPKSAKFTRKLLSYSLSLAVIIMLLVVFALSQYQTLSGYFRMNKQLKYYATPLNTLSAAKSYFKTHLANDDSVFIQIAETVKHQPFSNKPTLFVVVLGETARADHFSLNGYSRETNAELSQLALINFSQVESCGTATAHSVPCMFSWMNKDNYDEFTAKHSENVIDLIARAGFNVLWNENDGGCKDMCDRVKTIDVSQNEHCVDGCPDGLLFKSLLDQLSNLAKINKNQLIVLHQQGSHGPAYFRRSDKTHKKFLPECQDETFATCTAQEITNAYDNSIVETDALLAKLIKQLNALENINTGVLYVSDHGESLGENGVYLHGLPFAFAPDAQTHVPMSVWLSKSYQQDAKFDFDCLTQTAAQQTTHDALFGTLLALLSIEIKTEKPITDLVSHCRNRYAS